MQKLFVLSPSISIHYKVRSAYGRFVIYPWFVHIRHNEMVCREIRVPQKALRLLEAFSSLVISLRRYHLMRIAGETLPPVFGFGSVIVHLFGNQFYEVKMEFQVRVAQTALQSEIIGFPWLHMELPDYPP